MNNTDKIIGYYQMPKWTWKDKLRSKLFPCNNCMPPEAPIHFKECVVSRIHADLSFMDRLRVLFTGRVLTDVMIACENEIGEHKTNSTFSVKPWKFLDRK
jgi:hypothetical protein